MTEPTSERAIPISPDASARFLPGCPDPAVILARCSVLEVPGVGEQRLLVGLGQLGVGVGEGVECVVWFAEQVAGCRAVEGGEALELLTVHFALAAFDLGDGGAWDAEVVGDLLLAEPEPCSAQA